MTPPKQYVSRASTLQESLAAVAKLPRILAEAITRWGEIEVIVRKREKRRSWEQNKLQRKWCAEAAAQGDMTAEEYRGYCKLHFGVPILRRDSEDFREVYDRLIRPKDYEEKLLLMQEPFDLQVTRLMTAAQKREYLDLCWQHFTGLGFRLTDPNLKGMDPSQYKEAA